MVKKKKIGLLLLAGVVCTLSACGGSSTSSVVESHAVVSTEEVSSTGEEENDTYTDNPIEETSDSESETYAEEENLEASEIINDGPIFFTAAGLGVNNQSFSLAKYSMTTGEKTTIFTFENPESGGIPKYSFTNDITDLEYYEVPDYLFEQQFDSKIERVAVNWTNSEDNSKHVGWVDKEGNLTDITDILHPASSGFSSITPSDGQALFTSDDLFFFYNYNDETFCYVDTDSMEIVKTLKKEDLEDGDHIVTYFHGLNFDDTPRRDTTFIYNGIKYTDKDFQFQLEHGIDCVMTDGILTLLEVDFVNSQRTYIEAFGRGYSDISDPYGGAGEMESYALGEGGTTLTPESEYIISSMAYSNGTIAFTGTRGQERLLFKMSFVNGEAGEPEIVETIDNSCGDIVFWKE